MARTAENQPPLIETVELLEKMNRGEDCKLTLADKKRLYIIQYGLTTVYFIAAVDAGVIKIGKTVNLKKRLATLRTMSPVALELVHTIDYDDELESRIHGHLKEYRSHGEWFHADTPVLDFVRGCKDNGIRWVVDQVGDGSVYWMNSRKTLPEEMQEDAEDMSRYSDPDYKPNTQNHSGIDHT